MVLLPERDLDRTFTWDKLRFMELPMSRYAEVNVIATMAIETYGNYELYYSRRQPQLSIDFLQQGLMGPRNEKAQQL